MDRQGVLLRRCAERSLIALTAVAFALAPSAARAFAPDQTAAFQQTLEGEAARGEYPGLMLGVWSPGEGRFVAATGVSDVATGAPLSTDQPSRIGSITKTFTGTLVMQLVQRGQLGLQDTVSEFIRGIPRGREITIHELLNHTSGSPDISPIIGESVAAFPQHHWTPFQLIRWSVGQPRQCAPGKCWFYSNLGFFMLGRIVEKVTGRELADLYRLRIFDRLGLDDTHFRPGEIVPADIAHGNEEVTPDTPFADTTHWNFSWAWSAGGMVSTLEDLRVYARALATGRRLLNAETQRRRLRFVNTTIPDVRYGLGLANIGGFIGHNGAVAGYDAMMLHSPSDGTTIVVLGNTATALDDFGTGRQPDPGFFNIARELKAIVDSG